MRTSRTITCGVSVASGQRENHRPRGLLRPLPDLPEPGIELPGMSFTSVIVPMGCLVARASLETSLCNGVSTTPGATALKRMPSFAYAIARLFVTAFKPPTLNPSFRKAPTNPLPMPPDAPVTIAVSLSDIGAHLPVDHSARRVVFRSVYRFGVVRENVVSCRCQLMALRICPGLRKFSVGR